MVQIIEKPEWVSWNEIHDVIWKAHESNRQQGINMRFPALPGEEIKKRVEGNGKMYVALDGNKVVGTAAFRTKKANLWCGKGSYAYYCFASVLPEYRGKGINGQLYEHIESESLRNGLSRIMFDSHEKNSRIAEINQRHGYKKVSYKRYDDHYNIVFVKWLDGCPYSESRCKVEFAIQKLKEKAKTLIRFCKSMRN